MFYLHKMKQVEAFFKSLKSSVHENNYEFLLHTYERSEKCILNLNKCPDSHSFCRRYSGRGAFFCNWKEGLSQHQPGVCEGQLVQDEAQRRPHLHRELHSS